MSFKDSTNRIIHRGILLQEPVFGLAGALEVLSSNGMLIARDTHGQCYPVGVVVLSAVEKVTAHQQCITSSEFRRLGKVVEIKVQLSDYTTRAVI